MGVTGIAAPDSQVLDNRQLARQTAAQHRGLRVCAVQLSACLPAVVPPDDDRLLMMNACWKVACLSAVAVVIGEVAVTVVIGVVVVMA